MRSFKQYISEQPVIQPTSSAPTNTNQTQAGEDEGGPTAEDVCDWLLFVYSVMGCFGVMPTESEEDEKPVSKFDCEAWKNLCIDNGCLSAGVPDDESQPDEPVQDEKGIVFNKIKS